MAYANIPATGEMHRAEIHREKLIREQTTVDPVERYTLRKERLSEGLNEASAALVKQANENAKSYQQIIDNSEKSTRAFYANIYKEI